MGQTLEMLLAAEPAKVKNVPTGQIEIKRLSKQLGQPFIVTFRAGTLDELKSIGENADGNETEEMKWAIYELTTDPSFKDKGLRERFGVARPVDIVDNILLGGEVLMLYQAIMKSSGFDKDTGTDVEAVKN